MVLKLLLLLRSPVEDRCRSCGSIVNCSKIERKGRVTFIEISRLNFESGRKSNVLLDFNEFNFIIISCILHISDLRKHHLFILLNLPLAAIGAKYKRCFLNFN